MTGVSITEHAFGTPGAERLVVLLAPSAATTIDPRAAVTASRDVHVLSIAVPRAELADPGAFGGETPAALTAEALVTRIREAVGQRTCGIVASRVDVDVAARIAAALGGTVDRLALLAVSLPELPLERDELADVLAKVQAKTLIMNATREPDAGNAAATWFRDRLPDVRVEMVPGPGAVTLPVVWDRVLSHVAPGTKLRAEGEAE